MTMPISELSIVTLWVFAQPHNTGNSAAAAQSPQSSIHYSKSTTAHQITGLIGEKCSPTIQAGRTLKGPLWRVLPCHN